MTRTAATITAVVVFLAALTGCATDTTSAPAEPSETPASAAVETVEPLVAEEPAAAPEGAEAEALYLEMARERLPSNTIIPNATDEQLLAAGWEICERREAGEESTDISVIEGEERAPSGYYRDSVELVQAAAVTLCIPG